MTRRVMKGWLVVNGFLRSDKFNELYAFFIQNAKQLNIDLQLVTTDSLVCEVTDMFSQFDRPNFVLFWDKDTTLARRLENIAPVFNKPQAIAVCDSKVQTVLALSNVVPMPKTVISPKTFANVGYTNLQFVDKAVETLGLPVVIKEAYGSFGEQVYLAQTPDEAKNIVRQLQGKDFVMQQFVSESYGRDLRVNVVGGKVVNALLRHSNSDFRSNVTLGGSMTLYAPTSEQIDCAERACKALNLDFAGVDLLFGKDGPLLCEVNSNPHFKTTYDCSGVDLSKLILQHIIEKIQ